VAETNTVGGDAGINQSWHSDQRSQIADNPRSYQQRGLFFMAPLSKQIFAGLPNQRKITVAILPKKEQKSFFKKALDNPCSFLQYLKHKSSKAILPLSFSLLSF
jgi:hypothetical protein